MGRDATEGRKGENPANKQKRSSPEGDRARAWCWEKGALDDKCAKPTWWLCSQEMADNLFQDSSGDGGTAGEE